MFMKNWKHEIATIPNLLSLLRLALIPVWVRVYQAGQFAAAGGLLAATCLTDALDGKIARRFDMVSTLGKVLDPLADKLTQLALILCLSWRFPVLKPVLALFAVKELFQLVLGAFHLLQGRMLPGALPTGKVCTAVLFASLTALVLLPELDPAAAGLIALTDGIFLLVSFVSYGLAYFGRHPLVRDLDAQ